MQKPKVLSECLNIHDYRCPLQGFPSNESISRIQEIIAANQRSPQNASNNKVLQIISQLAQDKTLCPDTELIVEVKSFLLKVHNEYANHDENHSEFIQLVCHVCCAGIKWREIIERSQFKLVLMAELPRISDELLVELLCAMRMSDVRVTSVKFRSVLFEKFAQALPSMSIESLVSCLQSLAMMGIRWLQFSVAQRGLIINKVESVSYQLTSTQGCSIIWSLGTMGIGRADITLPQLKKLLNTVGYSPSSPADLMSSIGQCLEGVAKMKLDLTRANLSMRRLVSDMVLRLLQQSKQIKVNGLMLEVETKHANITLIYFYVTILGYQQCHPGSVQFWCLHQRAST
ncbi:hypothetical protein EON65_38495 [archaeon]|nr:MAG: hypothetical protein EON65_38495 [archaeon]